MASKARDAGTIMELAQKRYNRAKGEYELTNKICVDRMKQIDDLKVEIWKSFDMFLSLFERIKNRPELTGQVEKEKMKLTKLELEELKVQNMVLKEALVTGAGAVTGTAIGAVGTTALLSGIGMSAFTVMGVGQALVTTASFASVNVALYGAGAVFWPAAAIAAAATGVAALFNVVQGNKKMTEAEEVERQVDMAYAGFRSANQYLDTLYECASKCYDSMKKINTYYKNQLEKLDLVVQRTANYDEFTEEEKYLLEAVTILVVLQKKLTQTPLLVERTEELSEKNSMVKIDDEPREEMAEINNTEVSQVVYDCQREFEIIVNRQEEYIVEVVKDEPYEDVILGKRVPYDVKYVHKRVIVQNEFEIRKTGFTCIDCEIVMDLSGDKEIRFIDAMVSFEKCSFTLEKGKEGKIVCNGGQISLWGCSFENASFGKEGFFVIHNGSKVDVKQCDVSACDCTLFNITDAKYVVVDECNFRNHSNRIMKFSTCDSQQGVVMKNCNFLNFIDTGEYHEDRVADNFLMAMVISQSSNKNAILVSSYSVMRLYNCNFEKSDIAIVRGDALQELMLFEGCHFKEIHVGDIRIGKDGKEYPAEDAIKMPGGCCVFEKCEFIDVSNITVGGIGDGLNAIGEVNKCKFIECRGSYYFAAMEILDCDFIRCSAYAPKAVRKGGSGNFMAEVFATMAAETRKNMICIEGIAAHQKENRCLSEISGCTFEECEAKDYLIEPYNTMHRREISVSINNNTFINCKTSSKKMFALDHLGLDGRSEGILATESNNKVVVR